MERSKRNLLFILIIVFVFLLYFASILISSVLPRDTTKLTEPCGIQILNKTVSWEGSAGYRNPVISGLVINTCSQVKNYVLIEANIYDAEGIKIAWSNDAINGLEPWERGTFKIPIYDKLPAGWSYRIIIS